MPDDADNVLTLDRITIYVNAMQAHIQVMASAMLNNNPAAALRDNIKALTDINNELQRLDALLDGKKR